jgi:hypothetical protein
MSVLPNSYQQVEYIESSWTQYIDSLYNPNWNTQIKCKFAHNEHATDTPVFWARTSSSTNQYILWSHPAEYTGSSVSDALFSAPSSWSGTAYDKQLTKLAQWTVIEFEYSKIWWKYWSQTWTWSLSWSSTWVNMIIFWLRSGTSVDSRKFSGKMRYFQIYDNGILVRDLVPCYRKSDGVIGMYDKANYKFYTNSWSGTFTKWPDVLPANPHGAVKKIYLGLWVRLPNTYQEVEYIQSSWSAGTWQFIRTWYKANQNTAVEMSASANSVSSDTNACFYCSRTWGTTATFTCFRIGNKLRHDYNTTPQSNVYTISANTIYKIYANKNLFYVNDTLVDTRTAGTFSSSYAMLLLASNNGGDSTNIDNCFNGKLYYCKIWDNGTLVRDFIPCYRKSDNVIWMYDLANNQFYTNAWSGSFTKWADVPPYKQIRPVGSVREYYYDLKWGSTAWLQAAWFTGIWTNWSTSWNSDGLGQTSSSNDRKTTVYMNWVDLSRAKKITFYSVWYWKSASWSNGKSVWLFTNWSSGTWTAPRWSGQLTMSTNSGYQNNGMFLSNSSGTNVINQSRQMSRSTWNTTQTITLDLVNKTASYVQSWSNNTTWSATLTDEYVTWTRAMTTFIFYWERWYSSENNERLKEVYIKIEE